MYSDYSNKGRRILIIVFSSIFIQFYSNLTTKSSFLRRLEGLQIFPDVRSPELPSLSVMSRLGIEERTGSLLFSNESWPSGSDSLSVVVSEL